MVIIGMMEKRLWVYMGRDLLGMQISPSFMRKWLLCTIWPDDKEGMRVVQAVGRACAKP